MHSYLLAVKATHSTDPKTVLAQMRKMKIDDAFTDNGYLRPDGRMVHDIYLLQVKTPAESQGEYDLDQGDRDLARRQSVPPDRRRPAAARRSLRSSYSTGPDRLSIRRSAGKIRIHNSATATVATPPSTAAGTAPSKPAVMPIRIRRAGSTCR